MRWNLGLLEFLKPKHTLESVSQTLVAGLTDGTIMLREKVPAAELFPSLAQELEWASASSIKELIPALLEMLSKDLASFADVVGDLELLIELTRELRRTSEHSIALDLNWRLQPLNRRVGQLPIFPSGVAEEMRIHISEAIQLGKMLEIAVEQETSLLQELGLLLQLKLAGVLKMVLGQAASFTEQQVLAFVQQLFSKSPTKEVVQSRIAFEGHLSRRLSGAIGSRIENVQLLIKTLEMALERARLPMQAAAAITHWMATSKRETDGPR